MPAEVYRHLRKHLSRGIKCYLFLELMSCAATHTTHTLIHIQTFWFFFLVHIHTHSQRRLTDCGRRRHTQTHTHTHTRGKKIRAAGMGSDTHPREKKILSIINRRKTDGSGSCKPSVTTLKLTGNNRRFSQNVGFYFSRNRLGIL